MPRYLADQIESDLQRKMVFVGGPRQVGKTTLAKALLDTAGMADGYLNWDISEHREMILRRELPAVSWWVFDELHKYRQWRNWLKGTYDGASPGQRILVTGSARLDYYRFGGDSLQGRYHYLRLHPLSLAEIDGAGPQQALEDLLELGGFPEPFFEGDAVQARRWSREYRSRLMEEDLSSLERVLDVGTLELMMLRLPDLVGSPLSINALREDLRTSHKTVARWLDVLERLYGIFRVSPLGAPNIRAVKKEQKHYHFDWSLVSDAGARFENLVACHLLKWVHFRQDTQGEDVELRYCRDVTGREIDFVVTVRGEPELLVECKRADGAVSRAVHYFAQRFPAAKVWQVSATGERDYLAEGRIRVAPARLLLRELV